MESEQEGRIRVIGTSGKEGKGESQFAQPRGVCINAATKEIFVVDCNNHRIQVFHLHSLAFIRQIGKGSQGNSPGCLMYPVGICMGESDQIFVADTNNHRVVVFNHITGGYVRSIGSQGTGNGCLNCPYGVCIDLTSGYLYVADYENNRVQVFDSETSAFVRIIGDGQGNAPGQFNQPIDVCIDPDNDRLLVADYSNNRIQVFNKDTGAYIRTIGSSNGPDEMNGPRAICVNKESALLLVSDRENHRIQLYDKNTYALLRHIGNGFGVNPGQFNRPMELCVDNEEGVLIIVDGYNHRVQIMELPELRREKMRLKNAKRQWTEMDTMKVYPSALAANFSLIPSQMVIKSRTETFAVARFPRLGSQFLCTVSPEYVKSIEAGSFSLNASGRCDLPSALEVTDMFNSEAANTSANKQADIFMRILDEVAGNPQEDSLSLIAPSLLALQALAQRGWTPCKVSVLTANRLLALLLNLTDGSVGDWERQYLLKACVELLRVSISSDLHTRDNLFPKLLDAITKKYAKPGDLGPTVSDPLQSTGKEATGSSNFLILIASLELVALALSVSTNSKSDCGGVLLANSHSSFSGAVEPNESRHMIPDKDVTKLIVGEELAEYTHAGKRKRFSSGQRKPTSGSSRNSFSDLQLPLTFRNLIEKIAAIQKQPRDLCNTLRSDMLLQFANHVNGLHPLGMQGKAKDIRVRGGRNIWNGTDPIAVGDLVDCMDKEKSWFESLVIEVMSDGSLRIHFLGWGSKWDDAITLPEIATRIAPLNTHTRNWRSDLFEGGLIEIKCNDDIVNQKWMWGRITQLNIEESWLEVAYSFSNEPLVVKKAWLFGETICPVGMHTKDKSKAAAASITRPGKTVKEILMEKITAQRSDASFYDADDDYREMESKAKTIERGVSVGIIEVGSQVNLESSVPSFFGNYDFKADIEDSPAVAWISTFVFTSVMEEVFTTIAEVIGRHFVSRKVIASSIAEDLAVVKSVLEAIAQTPCRDLIGPHFVKPLYFQAGSTAKSIACSVQNICITEEGALSKILDLAEQLVHLNQLFVQVSAVTLSSTVCASSTLQYIQHKLQATIDFCGFTPVANEVLSTITSDPEIARKFFDPLYNSSILYDGTKKFRNFFRSLVESGSRVEVGKLFTLLEELFVRAKIDKLSPPSVFFAGRSVGLATAAVDYVRGIIDRINDAHGVINAAWISYPRLLLSIERLLTNKIATFTEDDSITLGKCLAYALNALMRRDRPQNPQYSDYLLDELRALISVIGNEEVLHYFGQYYYQYFFFRISQGNFRSLVEEKAAASEFPWVGDRLEAVFNQMEVFPKLNNEFARHIFGKIDDDSLVADTFTIDVATNRGLAVSLFKDSQVPGRMLGDSFASLILPSDLQRIMKEFNIFCQGQSVESASRIHWCIGLGRMEITCFVDGRSCCDLIVNEPQFVLLSTLAEAGSHGGLSIGQLALRTGMNLSVTAHTIASLTSNETFQLLDLVHPVSSFEDLHLNTAQLVSLTIPRSVNFGGKRTVHDCSTVFWESSKSQPHWYESKGWRETTLDATILRQLKSNLSLSTGRSSARDTSNALELANSIVRILTERHPALIFHEDEVLQRCKVLHNQGLISSTLGITSSNFKSSEVRYSYFSQDAHHEARPLWSRRGGLRPGKRLLEEADISMLSGESAPDTASEPVSAGGADVGKDESKDALDRETPTTSIPSTPPTNNMQIQHFLVKSLAKLSVEEIGQNRARLGIHEVLSTLMNLGGAALSALVNNLNAKICGTVPLHHPFDDLYVPALCVDSFLADLHMSTSGPSPTVSRMQVFPVLLARISRPMRQLFIASFKAVLLPSEQLPDAVHLMSFQSSLAILNKLWTHKFVVDASSQARLEEDWYLYLFAKLHLHPTNQPARARLNDEGDFLSDQENSENKHSDDVEYPSLNRRTTERDTSTPTTSTEGNGSLSLQEYATILIQFLSERSGGVTEKAATAHGVETSLQRALRRQSDREEQQRAATNAETLFAQPLKQRVQTATSSASPVRRTGVQPHLRSASQHTPTGHINSAVASVVQEVKVPVQPAQRVDSASKRIASSVENFVGNRGSPPPRTVAEARERSWIEDPILRFSPAAMEGTSRSGSDVGLIELEETQVTPMSVRSMKIPESAKIAFNDSSRQEGKWGWEEDEEPLTAENTGDAVVPSPPLLVDLSDAIPNSYWESTRRLGSGDVAGYVSVISTRNDAGPLESIIQQCVVSFEELLFDSLAISPRVRNSKEWAESATSEKTTVQVSLSLMDILLQATKVGGPPALWWMQSTEVSSVFQVVDVGLQLANSLSVAESSKLETDAIQHMRSSTACNVALGSIIQNPTKKAKDLSAFDSLLDELILVDSTFPFSDLLLAVSSMLQCHWSTSSVLLDHFHWDVDSLLEAYFHKSDELLPLLGTIACAKKVTQHVSGARSSYKRIEGVVMTCFSCRELRSADYMFSLKCGHFACQACWRAHIISNLASNDTETKDDGSSPSKSGSVRGPGLLVPCERNASDDLSSCPYVCSADTITTLAGPEYAMQYLHRIARDHQASYEQYQVKQQVCKATSAHAFFRVSTPETLACHLCHKQTDQLRRSRRSPQNNAQQLQSQQRASIGNVSSGSNHLGMMKLATDMNITVASMNHAGHLSRVQDCLADCRAVASQCEDLIAYQSCIQRSRFWTVYLDCQFLIDHCQSISLLDLDLLRQLKDLVSKQHAYFVDQFQLQPSISAKNIGNITQQALHTMYKLRNRLKELHDYPDPCHTRLGLSPTLHPVILATPDRRSGSLLNTPQKAVPASSSFDSDVKQQHSRTANKQASFLYDSVPLRWPRRRGTRSEAEVNLEPSAPAQVPAESSAPILNEAPNTGNFSRTNSELRSDAAPPVAPAPKTIVILDHVFGQLQGFATLSKASIEQLLTQLRDGYLRNLTFPISVEAMVPSVGRQRQWSLLVDLLHYPQHDLRTLSLVLSIIKFFAMNCRKTKETTTTPGTRFNHHTTSSSLPVGEDFVTAVLELLRQYHQIVIAGPQQSTLDDNDNDVEGNGDFAALQLRSLEAVEQCCLALTIIQSSQCFRLLVNVDNARALLEALCQLLHVQLKVDSTYAQLGNAAVAVLDLARSPQDISHAIFQQLAERRHRGNGELSDGVRGGGNTALGAWGRRQRHSQGVSRIVAGRRLVDMYGRMVGQRQHATGTVYPGALPQNQADDDEESDFENDDDEDSDDEEDDDSGEGSHASDAHAAQFLALMMVEASLFGGTEQHGFHISDLHVINLVDVLVSRYEDLQILEGHASVHHFHHYGNQQSQSRLTAQQEADETEQCRILDDLLCSVMMRLSEDIDVLETIYSMPMVFAQLISALHRNTSTNHRLANYELPPPPSMSSAEYGQVMTALTQELEDSTLMGAAAESGSGSQLTYQQGIQKRSLQILVSLLLHGVRHETLLSAHFDPLSTAIRDLTLSFLLPSEWESTSSASTLMKTILPLTMQLIAVSASQYETLRRRLLALDLPESLFFLREHLLTIIHDTQSYDDQSRMQLNLLQVDEAIQVLCDGAAALFPRSSLQQRLGGGEDLFNINLSDHIADEDHGHLTDEDL